jgi:endonuclease YncB( thermonuclease family)
MPKRSCAFASLVLAVVLVACDVESETPPKGLAVADEPAQQQPEQAEGGGGNGGSGAGRTTNALVTRVIDGDTIEVSYKGETLDGRRVRLEFDVERLDRYGRTLAYVWMGDRLFNETLVQRGFAQVSTFPPNVEYVDRFLRAQRAARGDNRGLWGRCEPDGSTGTGETPSDGASDGGCTDGYDPCLPPASDYDCAGGSGDGPEYTGPVKVSGSDPYGLDSDGDGIGCET